MADRRAEDATMLLHLGLPPIQGDEPYLYECLAATFRQKYPNDKITTYLCIPSRNDPALPTLERLLANFPSHNAIITIEDEDSRLSGRNGNANNLGPNPKIRNMSRAYREGEGDIVWIIDCNVWVGPDVASRMVDLLCGYAPSTPNDSNPQPRKYKFVHQLPLVIDTPTHSTTQAELPTLTNLGGLLEETFLSTSHAKFYTAINTVAIAPCIVGKSNMFRRSHLNALTSSPSAAKTTTASVPQAQLAQLGIDYFSSNICEDHLIGDLLWKNPVPDSVLAYVAEAEDEGRERMGGNWGNHVLLPPHPTNIAVQPTAGQMSLQSYLSRRVRWLRVRKFTVTLATLVEPGTESVLCSLYGAYGFTSLGYLRDRGVPHTWSAFWLFWVISMGAWCAIDWWVYGMLQSVSSREGERAPFADVIGGKRKLRWSIGWLGREVLAFPIWAWAFFGGVSVVWRGRRFRVGVDMRVREIVEGEKDVSLEEKGKSKVL
ncbi:uncharacterized protein KY384_005209 [Bacidia gigantensis]|uniref:uncharacterized protein n=1 Tax=Bacidia gigantensis TaxID=2732470 RepID=UPI001D05347F|nr:uncharacterized protein KY384_005209 [Bacidia gigantensis]KAG8529728.1 hypothetical protein KY384_005209 [Bacidia gigantensis]